MSLNLYYNKLLLLLFVSISFTKVLTPDFNPKEPEILNKNNKSREYYKLTKDGIKYSIKGPAEVKIFSKQYL